MMRIENETGDPHIGLLLESRYRLEERVGRGGMGAVFRGTDERLRREVAVKVIHAGDLSGEELARHRQRFTREAQLAARIQDPNVVTIHDYGTQVDSRTGRALDFIVMDLLRGESLAEWMPRLSRTDLSIPFSLLMQTAAGVAAGHRHGVVHRDVKPSNVLVVPAGKPGSLWVRVVDFGIAKPLHDDGFPEITVHPGFVGTASYASPEQLRGEINPRAASDVFSLGLVGYELFTGTLPLTEGDRNRLSQGLYVPVRSPRTLNPALPRAVEEVILRALSLQPEDRHADANAFAADLDGALGSSHPAAPTDPGTLALPDGTRPIPGTIPLGTPQDPQPVTPPADSGRVARIDPAPGVSPVQPPSSETSGLAERQLSADVPAVPLNPPPAEAPVVMETQRPGSAPVPVEPGQPAGTPADRRVVATRNDSQAPPSTRLRRAARSAALWIPGAVFAVALAASAFTDVPLGTMLSSMVPLPFRMGRELVAGEVTRGGFGRGDHRTETGARYDPYRFRSTPGPVLLSLKSFGTPASIQWGRTVNGRWQVLESSDWAERPWLAVTVQDGDPYEVRVQSRYSDAAGSYELTVAPGEPQIRAGEAFQGNLGAADLQLAGGDYVEEWTYRGSAGGQVTVSLDTASGARLEWGRVVGGEWMSLEEGESPLTATLADDGEYVVRVRKSQAASVRTRYVIILAPGPREIRPGKTERGRLSRADNLDGSVHEVWKYAGTSSQQVTLSLQGVDSARPYLEVGRVTGTRWEPLETAAPGIINHAARLVVTMDTGSYLVRARTNTPGDAGGPYELSVSAAMPTIALGQTRSGILSAADANNSAGWYYETWDYQGLAGQWIWAEVRGAGRYSLTVYRNENGRWILDSNSRQFIADGPWVFTRVSIAPNCQYRIYVFKDSPGQDSYSLRISA